MLPHYIHDSWLKILEPLSAEEIVASPTFLRWERDVRYLFKDDIQFDRSNLIDELSPVPIQESPKQKQEPQPTLPDVAVETRTNSVLAEIPLEDLFRKPFQIPTENVPAPHTEAK